MTHFDRCEELWDLLSAYADGMATPIEADRVERHTAICPDCARDLRFMQETAHVLADLPEVAPPARLRESILAATVNRPSWQDRVRESVRRLVPTSPLRALALAGSAAAIVLAVYIASTPTGQMAVGGSGTDLVSIPSRAPLHSALPQPAPNPRSTASKLPTVVRVEPDSRLVKPGTDLEGSGAGPTSSESGARVVQATQATPVNREDPGMRRRAELALLSRPDVSRLGIGRRSRGNIAALKPHVNELMPDLQPERVEQPRETLAGPAIDMADMKIPMTAMNTDPMSATREANGNTASSPAAAVQPAERSRVTLASLTVHESSAPASVLTLAELRQQLRRQNNETSSALHPELRLRTRRDTLDVVKSSF